MHSQFCFLLARLLIGLCVLVACPSRPTKAQDKPKPQSDDLSPLMIQRSIDKAREYLLREQQLNGSWECSMRTDDTRVGATSLVLLALANGGVPENNPSMQKALTWLRKQEPKETYSVSLQTMVLAMLSPAIDRPILTRNVQWLENSQSKEGPGAGSWSYGPTRGVGDNSNSQFALLGLHEAAQVGVKVNQETWQRSQQYWVKCANADGSWGYTIGTNAGTGSMTCAGITSVWITSEHTGTPEAQFRNNQVSCCGGGKSPDVLEKGMLWLGRNFSVQKNPGTGGAQWLYYYLYGLERVGRFTARRYIGQADWYLEGAKTFVSTQDALSGKWTGGNIEDATVATSFALLFLAKGRRPVIIAKSRHDPEADWNRHGHDVAHLVEYVEQRWRTDYPAGLSWHVVDTPRAQLDDLLQAPVLWLSGKTLFDLGPRAGARLREYIDEGGFIFAEACCSKSDNFDECFRGLVREIFPEPEYDLNLLPPEHPAWNAEEIVGPEFQRPLLGVDYGCRTCIIYVPELVGDDAGPSLSCLWELGGGKLNTLPANAKKEVLAALAIGTNVLTYATNRELKRKDELFAIEHNDEPQDRFERGRISIAKLRHGGLCNAAPAALANILRTAARNLSVRVDDAPRQIDISDPHLFDYHMVFMHGRQTFELSTKERPQLAEFLKRGGMLLCDSVCASRAFSEAFRSEMLALMPEHKLEPIPTDDPLFTAAEYGGFDIRQVTLREPAGSDGPLKAGKRQITPKLEGVRIGDRWAVIFSPYDLSCALEKQNSLECTGYSREDAEKIALNVILYSLHH